MISILESRSVFLQTWPWARVCL